MDGAMLMFVGGLIALALGADFLVRGAAGLAAILRMTPLVIGLTVVAFGTSAPELGVSLAAAIRGQADLAVGNAVGSNIFNVLAVLGVAALIKPIQVPKQLMWLDVPLMIVVSSMMLVIGWDGRISRVEGFGLLGGLLLYVGWLVFKGRVAPPEFAEEVKDRYTAPADGAGGGYLATRIVLMVVGLVLLVLGSDFTVQGAVTLATRMGVSPLFISLTIIAAATGLPEAATSIVAAVRGFRDIAVGNIIGSCIFNILSALGISAIAAKAGQGLPVPEEVLRIDVPIMIAVAVACMPVFVSGHRIARWEGLLFTTYYAFYVGFHWLKATGNPHLLSYEIVVAAFVLPLTIWHVMLATAREIRRQRWHGDVPPGSL